MYIGYDVVSPIAGGRGSFGVSNRSFPFPKPTIASVNGVILFGLDE